MPINRSFDQTVRKALDNQFLQMALKRATGSFKSLRAQAEAELDDFQELRLKAKTAKDRALGDLERHLVKLEENVIQAGGKVFWASDGQDVIDYIIKLARAKNLKTVVKGKSMTTEEIDLNPGLIQAGLEVMETDLGEYIIQLLGERPSHIIGPAIHKTKEEIARLFEERLGQPYTDDPEELTAMARKALRSRFLQADLGITGVNFAVAETGTLVLLENEGNIRMSTTLPKIHVAVMGLEKVVADLNDLSSLLRILPLAAVGQRLPSYVSMITGCGRDRGEGPEELHLVILDGFRSRVLGDPVLRQVLRCLRCGACLNFCPVYGLIGGHSYPWIYSGPIGVALTGAALGEKAAAQVIGASTLCRTCNSVCPVMIDLAGIILELRRRLARQNEWSDRAQLALARGLATPKGFSLAGDCLDLGARLLFDPRGRVRRGPEDLKKLGKDAL